MYQDSNGPLDHLVRLLAGLPGLGGRSARRIALHLLTRKGNVMIPLADALRRAAEEIRACGVCGNLDVHDPCGICRDTRRDSRTLCVVAHIADLWAIERTGAFRGVYHVLGGLLSAIDGVGPRELRIADLNARIETGAFGEIVLALSATVDGQSTAHYIADQIAGVSPDLKITRLAHGVPVGGELDYLDDGTIITAMNSRARA